MQRKEDGNAQTRVRNVLHDGKSGGRPPRIGSLSVITLMHRPGCTSPHLRLRISSVTTLEPNRSSLSLSRSSPNEEAPRFDRRSIESMGQRGSPICLRTNRNCSCLPFVHHRQWAREKLFTKCTSLFFQDFRGFLRADTISRNSRKKIRHRSTRFLFLFLFSAKFHVVRIFQKSYDSNRTTRNDLT